MEHWNWISFEHNCRELSNFRVYEEHRKRVSVLHRRKTKDCCAIVGRAEGLRKSIIEVDTVTNPEDHKKQESLIAASNFKSANEDRSKYIYGAYGIYPFYLSLKTDPLTPRLQAQFFPGSLTSA